MKGMAVTCFVLARGKETIGNATIDFPDGRDEAHKSLCWALAQVTSKLDAERWWGEADIGFYLEAYDVPEPLKVFYELQKNLTKARGGRVEMQWSTPEPKKNGGAVHHG